MEDNDKLRNLRQPLVTVTGILLGFTLSIASNWTTKAFSTNRFAEYLVGLSLWIHIPMSIIVLYRILRVNYPKDKAGIYYQRTLNLFITSITLYFLTIMLIMIESFAINR